MKLPRGNPALIVLFLVGIVLPSIILSVLSFRSIRNEIYLAEKAYEDDSKAFKNAIQQKLQQEVQKLLEDTRKRSMWLFDQPRTIEEMSKMNPVDSIPGVRALFLFDGDQRVFPRSIPGKQIKTGKSQLPIDSFEVRLSNIAENPTRIADEIALRNLKFRMEPSSAKSITNLVGLLRLYYKNKDWKQCMAILDLLGKQAHVVGKLQPSLRTSLHLLKFKILMESGHLEESLKWAEILVSSFLAEPIVDDIEGALFLFETMFISILSYEELSSDARERIWNLRRNLGFQLRTGMAWSSHEGLLQRLQESRFNEQGGFAFLEDNGNWGFRMTRPWLPGEQMVLGIIDAETIRNRLLNPMQGIIREWKHVYFNLVDPQGISLLSHLPTDSLALQQEVILLDTYPNWALQIYQRDHKEIRRESRTKMILLYSLVGFSLLVLVLGSFFVTQGITQERSLLAMKGNFLSSVSHELKTPLTSIRMFSEMMAQGRVQKPEKVAEYATLIGKEAYRLENLIQAILSYTRMERGNTVFQWELLDFSQCVTKVIESIKTIAMNKGLELQTQLEPHIQVNGDYASLHSLIQNLIDNAIKYTPAPGSVSVSLESDGDFLVFRVADTGIGIPANEQKNIFNDFYRVGDEMTRSTKGSGLGLAIVRRAAEAHHATISLQSKSGKGSTFTVRMKRVIHEQ